MVTTEKRAPLIGVDEAMLIAALVLIAAGFWMFWRPGAFLVPGAVLLWIALPMRRPLLERLGARDGRRREMG